MEWYSSNLDKGFPFLVRYYTATHIRLGLVSQKYFSCKWGTLTLTGYPVSLHIQGDPVSPLRS